LGLNIDNFDLERKLTSVKILNNFFMKDNLEMQGAIILSAQTVQLQIRQVRKDL